MRDFNYLGYNISYARERKSITSNNRMCGIINRKLKGKRQLLTKIKFYKEMAGPVLMYGSENWSINRSDKRKIKAAEMRFFTINGRKYTLGQQIEVAT